MSHASVSVLELLTVWSYCMSYTSAILNKLDGNKVYGRLPNGFRDLSQAVMTLTKDPCAE